MADEAAATWSLFLDDARVRAREVRRVIASPEAPALEELRGAASELHALRTGAHLVGVDGVARLAAAFEAALDRVASVGGWGELRPAGERAIAALVHALDELSHPDASGARVIAAPLDEATRALAGESDAPASVAVALPSLPTTSSSSTGASDDETRWVPQVDDDMIDPFIEEASERLEALAQKLVRLEQSPGDGSLVRDIFRDLHTVKGSSGFVGLRKMNRLAHAAEDLVGQLRDGVRAPDRAVTDALLAALDGLRAILDRATSRAPIDVALEPLLARLRVPVAAPLASPPPATQALGPAADAHDAHEHHEGGAKQTLRVDFDKLDLLLNLVGELVLNKANLHGGVASFAALGRELDAQLARAKHAFRKPSTRAVGARWGEARWALPIEGGREGPPLIEDLDRAVRVFGELSTDLGQTVSRVDHVAAELRQQVMKLRMLPIARVFNKYHRVVRELANTLGKRVHLELDGADTELDKVLVEQLDEPLLHLVRNAIDHGCEPPERRAELGKPAEATLRLSAHHRGSQILVEVSDDGAGIEPARLRKRALEKGLVSDEELAAMDDRAVLDIIFRPGFSTATRISEVSGRGVGMDVVREAITRLKGSIEIASTPGVGTTFTLKLPLTLAIIQVLLIRVAGQDMALPLDVVRRTFRVRARDLGRVHDRYVLLLENEEVPLVQIADALDLDDELPGDEEFPVVLVTVLGEPFALACDRLVGKQEIVIKTLGELLGDVPCAAGATLVGDRVALILDVPRVVERGVRKLAEHGGARPMAPTATEKPIARGTRRRPRILIAEDSDLIRESLRRLFEGHGFDTVCARDGAEALTLAADDATGFDAVSTDVMMPNVDGYELTRRLRATERHRAVPIVMVTARGEKIDRVRGFDAGVDEYIVKPLDHAEILRAVDRHLRRAATTRPAPFATDGEDG